MSEINEEDYQIPSKRIDDANKTFPMFVKKDEMVPTADLPNLFKALGLTLKLDQAEDWQEVVDNGDGFFDFDSMLVVLKKKLIADENEKELKEAFRALDINNEGEIDTDELRFILRQLGDDLTEDDVEDMIAATDTDGSGKVDYDEFYALMMG